MSSHFQQKIEHCGDNSLRRILLHQMGGISDGKQMCGGNASGNVSPFERKPCVLFTPQDRDRTLNIAITLLDLVRMTPVHLGYLPVKCGLTLFIRPRIAA